MTAQTGFNSGRQGPGPAFVSDRSGSAHAAFMRLSARALAPLGALTAWYLIEIVGKPWDAARAVLGRPLPAAALILFIIVAMLHARQGANEIIEDYVHDAALKEKARIANTWVSRAIAAVWTIAILVIAAPK